MQPLFKLLKCMSENSKFLTLAPFYFLIDQPSLIYGDPTKEPVDFFLAFSNQKKWLNQSHVWVQHNRVSKFICDSSNSLRPHSGEYVAALFHMDDFPTKTVAHDRRIHPLCTGIPKWLCCTFFQTTQIESKRKNNPLCLMTLLSEQSYNPLAARVRHPRQRTIRALGRSKNLKGDKQALIKGHLIR